jgi:hypothetical protein
MDRLQTWPNRAIAFAMLFEGAIGKESDLEIGDVLKRGPSHLGADLALAIVRSDEKQLAGCTRTAAERQIQLVIGVILGGIRDGCSAFWPMGVYRSMSATSVRRLGSAADAADDDPATRHLHSRIRARTQTPGYWCRMDI